MLNQELGYSNLRISGGSPHLHEPFQTGLGLLNVPPHLLALQAVGNLHDVEICSDQCEHNVSRCVFCCITPV